MRWSAQLRDARRARGLGAATVARDAHVSASSLRSYESGRRHPSRGRLTGILDAIGASQRERNSILRGAGFSIDADERLPGPGMRQMSASQAVAEIHRVRWPAFVVNERTEIVAANAAGRRLWRLDPAAPGLAPIERNVLAFATDPVIADHVVNWDEAVGALIAAWKGGFATEDPGDEGGYAAQLMERLMSGDATYLARFLALWETTPASPPWEYRNAYRVVWDEPPFGTMRFEGFAWTVNTDDGIDLDDWIPGDAETWLVLEAMMRDADQTSAGTDAMRRRPSSTRSSARVSDRRT